MKNTCILSPRSVSQPRISFIPCERTLVPSTHKYTTTLSPPRRKRRPIPLKASTEVPRQETVASPSPRKGLEDRLPDIMLTPKARESAERFEEPRKRRSGRVSPGKKSTGAYFDWFTRMYAELQYGLMTMNRKQTVFKNNEKAIALEEEMKKICDKASSSGAAVNSIDRAKLLISKFNRIKTRGNYYITTDEFADCEVHLINESDSEIEQAESKLSDKIKLFIDRHGPKSLNHALSREQLALVPHLSYHVGPGRNMFIPYLSSDNNVTQLPSLRYSRDKKTTEKVFGTAPRLEYRQGKEPLSLRQIKKFGFWEAQLLSGDQPKSMQGKAFGGDDSVFFYSPGHNESATVFTLKLCITVYDYARAIATCRWNKYEFKVSLDMPCNAGEAVAYSNGRIVAHGGVLPSCRHRQEAENELRITDLSISPG